MSFTVSSLSRLVGDGLLYFTVMDFNGNIVLINVIAVKGAGYYVRC